MPSGSDDLDASRVTFVPPPTDPTTGQLFWGTSFVAGPQGELLAELANDAEETRVVTVDLARSEAVRRIWPFLRDRRIDEYNDLVRRFRD